MVKKNHRDKLQEIYKKSSLASDKRIGELQAKLPNEISQYIQTIAENVLNYKGVYTVLVTLLIHKTLHKKQDIRYHQEQLKNGFSGRTIDTKYITPTLKKLGLPAMSETGWLTRSLEQAQPYTLNYRGNISNSDVKTAFLKIIDYVQVHHPGQAENILVILLKKVIKENKHIAIQPIQNPESVKISQIIDILKKHFESPYKVRGASKLPVLSFYAMFSILMKELKRYDGCYLGDLGSHTASDRTSKTAGDIEIFRSNHQLIEALEIKHKKTIDASIIRVVRDKIYKFNPERYCIFSSGNVEVSEIEPLIREISEEHGCELIVNGIYPTLQYYFRLIDSRSEFLNGYSSLVEKDRELKPIHKKKWNELVRELNFNASPS
ncbi:MAG: hypothetical protein ACLFM4_02775 [Phormidium sp.]